MSELHFRCSTGPAYFKGFFSLQLRARLNCLCTVACVWFVWIHSTSLEFMVIKILESFEGIFHSRFMCITSNFSCEFADCQLAQDAACLSHLAPLKPVHCLQMLRSLKRGSWRRRHNWLFVYMYKAWCIAMANYDLSLNLLERMKHSETDSAKSLHFKGCARAVWASVVSSFGRKFRCRVHSLVITAGQDAQL